MNKLIVNIEIIIINGDIQQKSTERVILILPQHGTGGIQVINSINHKLRWTGTRTRRNKINRFKGQISYHVYVLCISEYLPAKEGTHAFSATMGCKYAGKFGDHMIWTPLCLLLLVPAGVGSSHSNWQHQKGHEKIALSHAVKL